MLPIVAFIIESNNEMAQLCCCMSQLNLQGLGLCGGPVFVLCCLIFLLLLLFLFFCFVFNNFMHSQHSTLLLTLALHAMFKPEQHNTLVACVCLSMQSMLSCLQHTTLALPVVWHHHRQQVLCFY